MTLAKRILFCCFMLLASATIVGTPQVLAQGQPPAQIGQTPVTPDPGEPLTLEEAIATAYANHGAIEIARQSVEAAQTRVAQARTGTLPEVVGAVNYDASGQRARGTSGGFFSSSQSSNGMQPQVALNFPLYDGGITRASVRQARANVERSAASLGTTRNSFAFLVSQDYYNQLRAEKTLELRREQETLAQEQLSAVEAQIGAGAAAEADRALPLSELRNRQVDRVQAENDAGIAANILRNTMGLPVGPPLSLVDPIRPTVEVPPLQTLLDEAISRRPEVAQAQADLDAAEEGVTIARINRRPRLDTSVAYDLTPADNDRREQWFAGASVSMPLFDSGLTKAREEEARTQVNIAEADLEQTLKDVTSEVEQAHKNVISARERVAASDLAVEAARVNLDVTTERYELGAAGSSILSLITAQVQYATAANSAIEALYDLRVARAQLDQAIGARQ